MKCPICGKPMRLASTDESSNLTTSTKYERKIYVCNKDDAWANTETPKPKQT